MSLVFTFNPTSNIARSTRNKPEERQKLIVKKLSENKKYKYLKLRNIRYLKLFKILKKIHDPNYINFLMEAYDSYRDNNYHRDFSVSETEKGLIPETFLSDHSIKDQLVKVLPVFKQTSLFCTDRFTPIYEHTLPDVVNSAFAALEMTEHLLSNNTKIGYAITSNPGHHAGRSFYGGFCFLNNVMTAAQELLEHQKKVCILDLDVHAGDGTEDIVKNLNNENLKAISIHMDPIHEYPHVRGLKNDFNLLIQPGCSIEDYQKVLNKATEIVNDFKPDYLLLALGCDTYYKDPEVVGKCGLRKKDFKLIGNLIKSCIEKNNCKLLITQEGGYDLDSVPEIVNNFIEGLTTN